MQLTNKIDPMPEDKKNSQRKFRQWVSSKSIPNAVFIDKTYYPYGCDISDFGWGCAWRCIQMMLTQKNISFEQMFKHFGKKQTLLKVYETMHPTQTQRLQYLANNNSWAPFDVHLNWAEPFIGYLVLADYGVKSELLLINKCPKSNAPVDVYEGVIDFQQFKTKLQNHFNQKKGLIMIDDGTYAYVIFGYTKNGNQKLQLLIGDPHINSNREEPFTGLYSVVLDEGGKQISSSITEAQKQFMRYSTYDALSFKDKPWMVLFASQ